MRRASEFLIEEMRQLSAVNTHDSTPTTEAIRLYVEQKKKGMKALDYYFSIYNNISSIEDDLSHIPNVTTDQRKGFEWIISELKRGFSPGGVKSPWPAFKKDIISPSNISSLTMLDFVLSQIESVRDRAESEESIIQQLNSLEDTIRTLEIEDHIRSALLLEISKMKFIIDNIKNLGPQDFWQKYDRLTADMVRTAIFLHEGNREAIWEQTLPMLKRGFFAINTAGSVASLIQILPKA